MGIVKIFGQGLATTARKGKLLAFLWPVYLLFALFVVAPFHFLLQSHLSRSLLGEKLFAGTDMLWIGDLVYKYQELPPLVIGWLLGTSLLFLVLLAFLNGGIIGRIAAAEEKVTLRDFFGDCGRYFGRFFRVFLLSRRLLPRFGYPRAICLHPLPSLVQGSFHPMDDLDFVLSTPARLPAPLLDRQDVLRLCQGRARHRRQPQGRPGDAPEFRVSRKALFRGLDHIPGRRPVVCRLDPGVSRSGQGPSQGRSRADRPFSLAAGLFPGEALDGRPVFCNRIPFPESAPTAGLRQPFALKLRLSNWKTKSAEV